MSKCKHLNFDAMCSVNRLEDTGRFHLDVRVHCTDCGKPMRFIGLPVGLDMNGASVSPDGTEGRFAIHPRGEEVPGLSPDQPAGFRQL